MKVVRVADNFCELSLVPTKVGNFVRFEIPSDYRYYKKHNWFVHLTHLRAVLDYATKFCGVEVDLRRLPATIRNTLDVTEEGDPYSVLHIRPSAPLAVVKAAYRALCKEHHPDRGGSTELYIAVDKAYQQVLCEHSRGDSKDPAPSGS